MGPCLQKPIMKVPLFTQRMVFLYFTRRIFIFHTEDHGISRRFLDIDYNSDNFSVAISDSPCEERKTVILRDHPCEKRKRDSPCEKKISLNK